MSAIKRFLDRTPDAVRHAKGMLRAIGEKRISLRGKPEDIVKRAYDYERRGWEHSIESFFDAEDKLAAEKLDQKEKKRAPEY